MQQDEVEQCSICFADIGTCDCGEKMLAEELQKLQAPEGAWDYVIKVMADYPDRNDKAVIVQNAISELGPVPNSMGAAVRKAMSNGKNTLDT